MECELLGWPEDGPTIRLDHRRFSYAGKFVMSNSGKAVIRESSDDGSEIVAVVSFNEDRTDPSTLWIRYVTVRDDRRGDGLGPQLVTYVVEAGTERGYRRIRIAVNNPYAYEALYKSGFEWTGETTGIAELVLERPLDPDSSDDRSTDRYHAGFETFLERDLEAELVDFCHWQLESAPPSIDPAAVGRSDE